MKKLIFIPYVTMKKYLDKTIIKRSILILSMFILFFVDVANSKETRLYCKHKNTQVESVTGQIFFENIVNIGDEIIILDTETQKIKRAPYINDIGKTTDVGLTVYFKEDFISWSRKIDNWVYFEAWLNRDTLELETEQPQDWDSKVIQKSKYSCSISRKKI